MANQTGLSDLTYLILGTSAMVLMMFAIILFVYLFQRKLAAKARAYAEIEQLMHKQELQSAYFLIEGQEQERKRIAEELHDNIGGLLATLKIYSDLTLKPAEATETQRLNGKINDISESLSNEVRKLSHELDLRTLSGFGLKIAVQQLCEAITASGKLEAIPVLEINDTVPDDISLHLYRIIQELLTNTLKHAMATSARVEISVIGNEITVIYEDNGKGYDVNNNNKAGMGLKNILSRANRMNAKLTIDSSANGTTVILEIASHE